MFVYLYLILKLKFCNKLIFVGIVTIYKALNFSFLPTPQQTNIGFKFWIKNNVIPAQQMRYFTDRVGNDSLFTRTPVLYLPTISSSISDAFFRILVQISTVKMVLLLLNMDVRELIRADIITAIINPRAAAETEVISDVAFFPAYPVGRIITPQTDRKCPRPQCRIGETVFSLFLLIFRLGLKGIFLLSWIKFLNKK